MDSHIARTQILTDLKRRNVKLEFEILRFHQSEYQLIFLFQNSVDTAASRLVRRRVIVRINLRRNSVPELEMFSLTITAPGSVNYTKYPRKRFGSVLLVTRLWHRGTKVLTQQRNIKNCSGVTIYRVDSTRGISLLYLYCSYLFYSADTVCRLCEFKVMQKR